MQARNRGRRRRRRRRSGGVGRRQRRRDGGDAGRAAGGDVGGQRGSLPAGARGRRSGTEGAVALTNDKILKINMQGDKRAVLVLVRSGHEICKNASGCERAGNRAGPGYRIDQPAGTSSSAPTS